tara:strand:+ start:1499 stop:2344 length:846 start_codon:yes stop_codon:yes gene_type:complete
MTHLTRRAERLCPLDDNGDALVMNYDSGLWLIGVGPGNVGLMSIDAIEIVKSCDLRFLEGYTALLPNEQEEKLEVLVGNYEKIMRHDVEQPEKLLDLAKKSRVALMVVGDPLQATTHIDLQLRAAEKNIECHVIHGISITTIVTGVVGLQSYRFGRQVTIAYPYGEYLATSPFEMILDNLERNLHTLVFLDLDPSGMGEGKQIPMTPQKAVEVMQLSAEKLNEDINEWKIVLCSDMGTDEQCIRYGSLDKISEINDGMIHCIVIPGRLDELEREALERWDL